jgi:hypothetical protein
MEQLYAAYHTTKQAIRKGEESPFFQQEQAENREERGEATSYKRLLCNSSVEEPVLL